MAKREAVFLLDKGLLWILRRLARRFYKGFQLPFFAWHQYCLARVLLKPAYRPLVKRYPLTFHKYFNDDHLSRGFCKRDRADCMLLHYKSLLQYLPGDKLSKLIEQEIGVMQIPLEQFQCSITLGFFEELCEHEGELSLRMRVDGEEIYAISFTLAPGRIVQQKEEKLFLVTRVQGVARAIPTIQLISDFLCQNSIAAVLFAALEGLGKAWGIQAVAGVGVAHQRASTEANYAMLAKTYDEFFLRMGMKAIGANVFFSTMPFPQKPLSQIKAGHKIRTRKKRAFRNQVTDAVTESMLKLLAERAG